MTAPKLDFVIDQDYLVFHSLSRRIPSSSDLLFFLCREAYRISESTLELLRKNYHPKIVLNIPLKDRTTEERDFVEKLKATAVYQAFLQQTYDYQRTVKAEWNANLETSLQFMQEKTGLPLDSNYTVFLTHPSLSNGIYIGNRRIAWGGPPVFENYNTVYLWHEVLHDDEIIGTDSDIGHAIIESVTDNGLRVHLNGGNHEPLVGHPHLDELRREIFDNDWQNYLASSPRDILAFKVEMEEKYKKRP